MRKYGDIIKLLLEEITDLKSAAKFFLLHLFFIVNVTAYAQPINISGFVNITKTNLPKGYEYFFINTDKEGNSEIILFKEKGCALLQYSKGSFGKLITYPLNFTISYAKKIFEGDNESYFVGVARKERAVLIFSLSKEGVIKVIDYSKFYTYPAFSDVYLNTLNNTYSILISGLNFSGLWLLQLDKQGKIFEKNYIKGNSYKSAFLIDLNWDFMPDIVAFNSIFNKLDFLYSVNGKQYNKEREHIFNYKCTNITTDFFNEDNYLDIITSGNNGIEVMYGDSVFSYNNKMFSVFNKEPNELKISEFNNNNNKDIIFTEKRSNKLNIVFDCNINEKSNNCLDYSTDKIKGFDFFRNKNESKLFYTDDKNNIYCIEKVNKIVDNTTMFLPGLLGTVIGNMPLNIICYIDYNKLTFNVIQSDKLSFSKFYTCKIADNYDKIKIFSKADKTYFVMTKGESEYFGIVLLNNKTGKIESKNYYTKNNIHDFSINTIEENIVLTLVTKNYGKIELVKFILNNTDVSQKELLKIDANVFDAKVNNYDPKNLIYCKYDKTKGSLIINRYDMEKEKIFYTSEIKVKNAASIKINSLFMRYDNHSAYFSLINVDSLYYTVLYNFKNGKSFIRQLEKERNEIISSFSIENKLVWYNKFLLINNSKNGIFVKLDTSNPNEFVFEKVEVPYTDNYFVTVIDKKPYLIYKVEDNIIKFKEIGGNK